MIHRKEVLRIIHARLGENPSPEKVVDLLYSYAGITDTTARMFGVGVDFMDMMSSRPNMTASDIEQQLSETYGISDHMVKYIRTSIWKGGNRGKKGRRQKG